MNKKTTPCGFECHFPDLKSVWKFFDFSNIEFGSHYFSSADDFILLKGKGIDFPAQIPTKFSSDYFKELIQQSFVTEYLVLHLYPESSTPEIIVTYAEYVKSQCEMIVLLYDCYFLEIYCKNPSWLNTLIKTAQEIPNTIVELKYEETDQRTEMYV